MAPDKRGIGKIFFLFLHENILWVLIRSTWGASNEYHNMFLWRNNKKKNQFLVEKHALSGAMQVTKVV